MKKFIANAVHFVSSHVLASILVLGFVHGALYAFLIPPWWNYDEAGHFEYAWLAATRPAWPQIGDYDNAIRLQIGESSLRFGFDSPFNFKDEKRFDNPINIGVSQVGDLPLYYWLASLPLRLLHATDVLVQMYVLRMLSVVLLVAALYCAWKTVETCLLEDTAMPWMVTLFLAMLPGFVNIMASVNNDTAAAAVAAFYIWLSTRIIKQGWSWLNILGWVAALVLCLFTRDVTRLLLVSAPFVLWGRVSNRRLFFAPIVAGVLLFLTALFVGVQNKDARYWVHSPVRSTPNRIAVARAPFGKYALTYPDTFTDLGQVLPSRQVGALREQAVTLGVWMWAEGPSEVRSPAFYISLPSYMEQQYLYETVRVDTAPKFYVFRAAVPAETLSVQVRLLPHGEHPRVYYDGLVLVAGEHSDTPPSFDDDTLSTGVWDGSPFTNLLRNGSAEAAWLNVAPWVDEKSSVIPFARERVSLILATFQDWPAFGWYYRQTFSQLFQTFWDRAAAAQVSLPGGYTYDFLQLVVVAALIGAGLRLWRARHAPPQTVTFLGVVLLSIWGVTCLRGAPEVLWMGTIPWARYAFSAFVPTALLLCVGWKHVLDLFEARTQRTTLGATIFCAFVFGFALFALLNMSAYFYQLGLGVQQILILCALIGAGIWIIEYLRPTRSS